MNINNANSTGVRGRQSSKAMFEDGTYDLEHFHDVFIEYEDPTEYKPALELVGSWREWQRIKRDWKGFNGHIEDWKAELEVRLRSKAVDQINKLALDGGNFQASKWMAEVGYEKRSGAGRPSKSEKARAARELAEQAASTKEDKARILKLVNHGD